MAHSLPNWPQSHFNVGWITVAPPEALQSFAHKVGLPRIGIAVGAIEPIEERPDPSPGAKIAIVHAFPPQISARE